MNQPTLEIIRYDNTINAIILRHDYSAAGVQFFSPEDFPQQIGYIAQPKDYLIEPHIHREIPRQIVLTQEVLFIKKGKLQVDFYTREQNYLESRVLEAGDIILLSGLGHGYKVIEDVEMIEIKQGPYLGQNDKIRFKPHDYDPSK